MTASNNQISNTRVLVAQIPEGVAPNKSHFRTIAVTEDKPELEEGSVFIKNAVLSLDPCMTINTYDIFFGYTSRFSHNTSAS
jgi:NADPH-dependent curcumin reductase CurA